MRTRWAVWFLIGTVWWAPVEHSLVAADRAFVGKLAIAVSEEGVKRLGLSPEMKGKLLELIDKREREALSLALELKELPPEQRDLRLAPFVADSERQGVALLTVDQRAKLDQLRIAQDGMGSLREPDVARLLGLSDDQRARVDDLMANRQRALTRGGENDRRVVRSEYERQLANLLTQEQRANWEKLAGLSVPPVAAAPAGAALPKADSAPPAAVPAPQAAPTQLAGAAPSPPAAARQSIGEPARREDGEILLKFNFQHAPWKDVLEWFADQAELSLQLDNPPPGTCNYRDTRSFTPAEAIDLMNSMLLTKGFTLVRYQRLLTVLNLEDPIPPQIVELVPLQQLNERGDFELIKVLFPLSKMEPAEAEAEVAKLIGPQGSIVSLPKSRQLLVTETAGRLRTIREVISAVENPQSLQLESIRQVALKHVGVEEFLAIARPLLGVPEGQNQSADIRLALDPYSPRIFATGIPAALKRLEEIVPLVDRPSSSEPSAIALKPLEQPQLETYPIGKTDPATVLQVTQTLLAGLPDVRLAIDSVANKLVALARPSEHRTIVETLKQLEGYSSQIEVIKLRRLDPQNAILAINKMFGPGNEKDKAASDAPKVDGDPATMKIWVRGSAVQIAMIKDLIEKLEGPLTADDQAARQALRFLPVPGSSTRATLESIEAFWPTMRPNKIRVVTPSAISPSLRQQSSGSASDKPATPPPSANAPPAFPPGLQLPPGVQFRFIPPGSPPIERPAETRPDAAPPETSNRETSNGKPASSNRVRKTGAREASRSPNHRSRFQLVAWATEDPEAAANGQPAPSENSQSDESKASQAPARPGTGATVSNEKPEILVTVTPQGIFIASKDLDALDDFEKLLRTFVETRGAVASGEPTVFWLKFSKADVTAELLNQVLNGVGAGSSSGGGGSLLGDVASNVLGEAGGLLGGLLGGGGGGGTAAAPGSTTIVPDVRLNCLIVQGRPQDIVLIEQLLPIIDREASPEEISTTGKPRLIPVIYMTADAMATIVRQVFADRVAGSGSGNQPRQPSPEDFINALRGGGRGRSQNQARGEVAKMTIGVDSRSNSLIVAAPEPLFKEVEAMVVQLDQQGSESNDSMEVMTIRNSNAVTLQKALTSITGGQVKVNAQTGTTGSTASTTGSTTQPGSTGMPTPGASPDDIRRRIEFFQSLQGGGGRFGGGGPGGGPGGGGAPGGGGGFFGRGGFGGGGFGGGGFGGGGFGGGGGGGGGDRGGGGGDRGAGRGRGN